MLNNVSRSFAIVIQQLGPELRDAARSRRRPRATARAHAPSTSVSWAPPPLSLQVCIFYLVLRALDTVEDDMSIDKARAARAHTSRPGVQLCSLQSHVTTRCDL